MRVEKREDGKEGKQKEKERVREKETRDEKKIYEQINHALMLLFLFFFYLIYCPPR